jgi:hypothetical protein
MSVSTSCIVLHQSLDFDKKNAKCVPKLLSNEQKQQPVEVCTKFVTAPRCHSLGRLDSTVAMDEIMLCYHTLQTKKQSKLWNK